MKGIDRVKATKKWQENRRNKGKKPTPIKKTKRDSSYIQTYYKAVEEKLGLLPHELLCEVSGFKYQDIHHIYSDKMGGSKKKSGIANLMALTREAHIYFGDKKHFMDFLKEVHENYMKTGITWREAHPDDPVLLEFLKTLG